MEESPRYGYDTLGMGCFLSRYWVTALLKLRQISEILWDVVSDQRKMMWRSDSVYRLKVCAKTTDASKWYFKTVQISHSTFCRDFFCTLNALKLRGGLSKCLKIVWDTVEVESQIRENWCEEAMVYLFARRTKIRLLSRLMRNPHIFLASQPLITLYVVTQLEWSSDVTQIYFWVAAGIAW